MFALNGCVSEAAPEVVLGAISASMAPIARHGDNHFPVLSIVRETAFEAIGEVEEFAASRHTALHDARLDNLH